MKTKAFLFLALFLGFACLHPCPAAPPGKEASFPELYVHFFVPTRYIGTNQIPPKLILSAPVYFSNDFEVAKKYYIGSSTNVGGPTWLKGRIEPAGKKFHVRVEGRADPMTFHYEGDAELDKPLVPTSAVFSGFMYQAYFGISRSADGSVLLKQQADIDKALFEQPAKNN